MNENLKRYVELEASRLDLEAELKRVKAEMSALEPKIIEEMMDLGMTKAGVNGRTFYIARTLHAGAANGLGKEPVIAALKAAGYTEYVSETYNSQSLSALIRDFDREITDGRGGAPVEQIVAALPDPMREAIAIAEVFNLRSRKG